MHRPRPAQQSTSSTLVLGVTMLTQDSIISSIASMTSSHASPRQSPNGSQRRSPSPTIIGQSRISNAITSSSSFGQAAPAPAVADDDYDDDGGGYGSIHSQLAGRRLRRPRQQKRRKNRRNSSPCPRWPLQISQTRKRKRWGNCSARFWRIWCLEDGLQGGM
jgi:hypothetical protein